MMRIPGFGSGHSPLLSRAGRHGLQRGFTIIEILIVVAIVGVMASIGIPSMRDMIMNAKLRTASSDLYASLIFARSEAIKRNATIVVTPVGGDWRSGWNVTSGGTVMKTQDALPATLDSLGGTAITYRGNGRSTASASTQFVFAFSAEYPTLTARCVRLDVSGRPNLTSDTDGNAANGCN